MHTAAAAPSGEAQAGLAVEDQHRPIHCMLSSWIKCQCRRHRWLAAAAAAAAAIGVKVNCNFGNLTSLKDLVEAEGENFHS